MYTDCSANHLCSGSQYFFSRFVSSVAVLNNCPNSLNFRTLHSLNKEGFLAGKMWF